MEISATYYGANTWLFNYGELRVLIDPWLEGNLVFPPGDWLIKGRITRELPKPTDIGLILLTQGLADHTHIETLKNLDLNIPIIGSKTACSITKNLGFKTIKSLSPGEITYFGGLEIRATKGAYVPNIENGYILKSSEISLYIEPHGYMDKSLCDENADIVISPIVNLNLPIVGSFIRGKSVIGELIDRLNPRLVLASTVGGDIEFSGVLGKLINQEGNIEEIESEYKSKCRFINPVPGKPIILKHN
tara:strand:+ start:381 stop:1121 length:741 start_codon:yes stop_codon:yes gene_type:complete